MTRKRKKTTRASGTIDPHALIARLGLENKRLLEQEIIAPLLPEGRIRTRLNGLVYEFRVRERFMGWGRFRPLNEREAQPVGEAQPWERGDYLELFPLLRVVLLWPDTDGRYPGTWLALPYNESDAHQRFGLSGEPLLVFLCDPTAGAERFERVLTRVDGHTLWFEGVDTLADPTHADWLRTAAGQESNADILSGLASSERQALLYWRLRQLELSLAESTRLTEQSRYHSRHTQQIWLARKKEQLHREEELRHALAKADATLHSYSEVTASDGTVNQLIVEWSERGQVRRYRSALDPRLTVVSSGICLSGRDRDFDLTSLVNVMARSSGAQYEDGEYE